MKVAVCFSGYPRFVEECFEDINNKLLKNLDYDIFANFQWSDNLIGEKIHHEYDKRWSKNGIHTFEKMYENIKQIDVIEPYTYDTSWLKGSNHFYWISIQEQREMLYRFKSQYLGISDCVNKIDIDKYDYVLRLRTDLLLEREIMPDEIFTDSIVNQDGYVAGHDRRYSDWFFSCPTKHIDFFKDLSNLEEHYQNGLLHMHTLIEKLAHKYPIVDKNLGINNPSTSSNRNYLRIS